ncbi:MAG: hypothetical protein PHE59_04650 [Patescibacteria group bacterium]|nr:hypothetical protein [Patescibacteria group bacterium]MDD5164809.1 hypothetical protein [Patescibacteria group bacterium]MDD5534440.1 hypothetical protein [Patescibacteria group bacterium]
MKRSAQSLIETIVAIGMITVAIVAILSVGLSNLMLSGQTSERVIATNLAREGVEIINAIRSSQRLDPDQTWPYGMTNGNWIVDYDDSSLTAADSATIGACDNCSLYITGNDVYTRDSGSNTLTIYRRLINISDGDILGGNCLNVGDCEKIITSTVYWTERGRPHSIELKTHLTDWR